MTFDLFGYNIIILVIKNDMTNDKKAVWETIERLKTETISGNETHIDLRGTLWVKYSPEKMVRIRAILLSNRLISFKNEGSQWAFQLTADGILAKKWQFRNDGLMKIWYTQSFKAFKLIMLTALLTTAGTLAVELYKYKYLTQDHPQTMIKQTIRQQHGQPIDIDFVKSNAKK